jgi:hypothetical protein
VPADEERWAVPVPSSPHDKGQRVKLPPYSSLYLTRCAVAAEFPHNTQRIKKGTETDDKLLQAYRQKLGEIRRASLELAALELELKQKIGFNRGLEVESGILYWTAADPSGKSRRPRVNWMQLCKDYKISEETLKRYQREEQAERRFFLRRRVHTAVGISNLAPTREDIELDDEL